jgi:hypothetical protein
MLCCPKESLRRILLNIWRLLLDASFMIKKLKDLLGLEVDDFYYNSGT